MGDEAKFYADEVSRKPLGHLKHMTTMFTSNNNKQQIPGPIIKCFKRLCVAWRVSVSIDFLVPVQRSNHFCFLLLLLLPLHCSAIDLFWQLPKKNHPA